MALTQTLNTLGGTAVKISPTVDGNWVAATLLVQNNSTADTVYLGTSSVTTSAYGYVLPAGTTNVKNSLTISLTTGDVLYAISSGTATPVPVITLLNTFTKQVPA
jgi:hypothetical protein